MLSFAPEVPKRFTFFISDSQMPCGSSTRLGTISAFLRPDVTEFDIESTTDYRLLGQSIGFDMLQNSCVINIRVTKRANAFIKV